MTITQAALQDIPGVLALLKANHVDNVTDKTNGFVTTNLTTENSYQYGPVCVNSAYRGSGVFEQIFTASLASMQGRYPLMVTFINQINPRSYAAHTKKAGMTEVGRFDYNQNHYYLMACATK